MMSCHGWLAECERIRSPIICSISGRWRTTRPPRIAGPEFTPPKSSTFNSKRRGMLEAVIFDMDGVIVDSHPAHREAWRMFLRTLGKAVSDTDLDFVLDGRKRGEILRHFLGELSEAAMQEYGKRKDEYFREASLQVKPVPGVVRFMRRLENAGITTAVATSASESRTRHTLEHLRLI